MKVVESGPVAIIVGPMGAGKSTVGYYLSHELGVLFRDTDRDVERTAERPIPTVFADYGEPVFRELELRAVLLALEEHDGVLSLGGGAVMTPAIAAALEGRPIVFLDARIEDVEARIGRNENRPLLAGGAREKWIQLLAERRGTYERLARWTIDTSSRPATRVAREIAVMIRRDGASPTERGRTPDIGSTPDVARNQRGPMAEPDPDSEPDADFRIFEEPEEAER